MLREGPAESLCSECRQAGCAELLDQMNARHFEQPALYGRFHRLAVDAYCVQHDACVKSAKSLAAHLCGLCIAFEYGADEFKMRRVQQWLSRNSGLRKPELPKFRGERTIGHLQGLEHPEAYGRAVKEWARSAWEACRDLHGSAHEWVRVSGAGKTD